MAERLFGKTAVIDGAASGMGKAIALSFIQEGANIVAADINEDRLKELEQEVAELGLSDKFRYAVCNVTNTDDCYNAFKVCEEAFGTCDILSHNAGIIDDFTLAGEVKDSMIDRVIGVNLVGSMKMTRAALSHFTAHNIKGNIVVIISDAAVQSATGGCIYSASKAGLYGWMKAIAFEYSRLGIRINGIGPGLVASNIGESVGGLENFHQDGFNLHCTTGYTGHKDEWCTRTAGVPEDIAKLALFLASDESDYINNELIMINGGLCLSR